MRWFLLLIFVLPLCAQTPQENGAQRVESDYTEKQRVRCGNVLACL